MPLKKNHFQLERISNEENAGFKSFLLPILKLDHRNGAIITRPAIYLKKAASAAGTTGPLNFTTTVTATKQIVESIIKLILIRGFASFDLKKLDPEPKSEKGDTPKLFSNLKN